MPLINVQTSIANVKDSKSLLKELSSELSTLTNKPEKYVMTSLQTNVAMTFGGSTEPCCYIVIKSIGAINSSKMSKAFCEIITKRTDILSERIYLGFEDISPSLWGWDGRTFG